MLQFVLQHLAAILGLLCLSAFFAASETAIFSLPRVAREALAAKPDRASQRVTALMAHPRRLIITIIVCNELVNILNSSVAASMTSQLLPHARELVQISISTAVMLPLILFFGEMLPKSLALRQIGRAHV